MTPTPPVPTGHLTADRRILQLIRRKLGHGPSDLLFDLADLATQTPDGLIVDTSLRDIAAFAGSSKDTVRRSLDRLQRHRLIELLPGPDNQFANRRFLLHLDSAGITLAA